MQHTLSQLDSKSFNNTDDVKIYKMNSASWIDNPPTIWKNTQEINSESSNISSPLKGFNFPEPNSENLNSYLSSETFEGIKTDHKYFLASKIDSSTAPSPRPLFIDKEFIDIISSYPPSFEDNEDTLLIEKVIDWIEKYGKYALEVIYQFLSLDQLNHTLASEILSIVGDVNSYWSYSSRVWLLENYLESKSPKIRFGAIMGLSNLDSVSSIGKLENTFKIESNIIVKNTIIIVLEQFYKAKK